MALDDGQQQLTYTELNILTEMLAKTLVVHTVQREGVIAIYMERGLLQSVKYDSRHSRKLAGLIWS
ncbi:hypothetical protein P4S72_07735 [Vibrio sp. PP-XX7]